MSISHRIRAAWRSLWRTQADGELNEELRFHLEAQIEENLRRSMTRGEAERQARVQLGGMEQVKEATREMRFGTWMETLGQDVRYAGRTLRRKPAFTLVVVLTLALGIGANTSVFSLLDTVLLKQLPVREPRQLVLLDWAAGPKADMIQSISGTFSVSANGGGSSTSFSLPMYEEIRRRNEVFESVVAYAEIDRVNAQVDGQAEIVYGQVVSGNYHSGLGVGAYAGRMLFDEDNVAGAPPAAVISYRYWQQRFGGDRSAVGKALYLNGAPFTIVGVTPPGFQGAMQVGDSPDVTLPLVFDEQMENEKGRLTNESDWWVRVMGRLKPGVQPEQALANLKPIFHGMVTRNIPKDAKWDIPELRMQPGSRGLNEARDRYAQSVYLLLGGVALVLLVACTNVATLMLMRGESRRREFSVRLALGAPRTRLVRAVLVESVLLSFAGGAAGLLLAVWGSQAVVAALPSGPGATGPEPVLDWRVMLFTAVASAASGMLFGLGPALRWSRGDVAQAIKGALEGSGCRSFYLGKGLIAVQVGLSVILLVGAGLLGRTLFKLHSVQIGFDASNVLLGRVDPSLNGYKNDRLANFYERALERLRALPGVESAGLTRAPLAGGRSIISSFTVPGYVPAQGERMHMTLCPVSEGFLETMRVPLLAGRTFAAQDTASSAPVAIINAAMARKYFGQGQPLGRRFKMREQDYEIVGVVGDASIVNLRDQGPAAFVPYRQHMSILRAAHFAIRTRGEPQQMTAAMREAVRALDPNLPLFEVRTQEQQIEHSVRSERRFANLSGLFGGLALVLVCVGLAGMLSYEVSRRTREIGIRMALGGQPGSVGAMVLRQGLLLTALGIAAGLAAAVPLARYLESVDELLFEVKAFDAATYGATVLVLLSAAAAASWIPARRATRVDPLAALRHE